MCEILAEAKDIERKVKRPLADIREWPPRAVSGQSEAYAYAAYQAVQPERRTAGALFGSRRASRAGARLTATLMRLKVRW